MGYNSPEGMMYNQNYMYNQPQPQKLDINVYYISNVILAIHSTKIIITNKIIRWVINLVHKINISSHKVSSKNHTIISNNNKCLQ